MIFVLLRLVLAYLIVAAVLRLGRGIAEGLRAPRRPARTSVPLVRDPVCGTFVVPTRALTAGTGSSTRYFCSERCRRAYGAPSSSSHPVEHGR